MLIGSAAYAAPRISIPFSFEENRGQTDAQVRFLGQTAGAGLWLTESGAALRVDRQNQRAVLKMTFIGARRHPKMEGADPVTATSSYFRGRDESKWLTGIAHFGKVRYRDVYPGIDLVFYSGGDGLEYDWLVSPGADPRKIRMSFEGADKVAINTDGDLLLSLGPVEIHEKRPRVYQDGREIRGGFVRRGRSIGFELAHYDPSRALTIDPVLVYASALGGSLNDITLGIAIDPQGNIIAVGETASTNFPTKLGIGAIDTTTGAGSGFVAKINPTAATPGASLVWMVILAGSIGDSAFAVTTDAQGSIYVTGLSGSPDFPIKNNFQQAVNGGVGGSNCVDMHQQPAACTDAFVAKIPASGNSLIYSSWLGGSLDDAGFAIAVDNAGNAWVAGQTLSNDFPVRGSFFQVNLKGAGNGFLSEISPSGTMLYSSYFGGSGVDMCRSIAVDGAGNVYIAGNTTSKVFPLVNAYETTVATGGSGFAAKLTPLIGGQSQLVYSTYIGTGTGDFEVNGMAVDAKGNIYAAGGVLNGTVQTTPTAIQSQPLSSIFAGDGLLQFNLEGYASGDAMIVGLNPSAQPSAQLVYGTYLGGSFDDYAVAIAIDKSGRLIVGGNTNSIDFPTTQGSLQSGYAGTFTASKPFISVIDPTQAGTKGIVYSTYFGGGSADYLTTVGLNAAGEIAMGGDSYSSDLFVTGNAYQKIGDTANGDAWLALIDTTQTGPGINQVGNAASYAFQGWVPGELVTLIGTGLGPATLQLGAADSTGRLTTTVAGCQVLIGGTPAPIYYASATQTAVFVPYELTPKIGTTLIVFGQAICNGVSSNLWPSYVIASDPGVFSNGNGTGQGAIFNQDSSRNGPSNAAPGGSYIQMYATGEGVLTPAGQDGRIENGPLSTIPKPTLPVSVTIGGVAVPAAGLYYVGEVPGVADGVLQINAQVPMGLSGNAAVVVTIGKNSSQAGLTVAVK